MDTMVPHSLFLFGGGGRRGLHRIYSSLYLRPWRACLIWVLQPRRIMVPEDKSYRASVGGFDTA